MRAVFLIALILSVLGVLVTAQIAAPAKEAALVPAKVIGEEPPRVFTDADFLAVPFDPINDPNDKQSTYGAVPTRVQWLLLHACAWLCVSRVALSLSSLLACLLASGSLQRLYHASSATILASLLFPSVLSSLRHAPRSL